MVVGAKNRWLKFDDAHAMHATVEKQRAQTCRFDDLACCPFNLAARPAGVHRQSGGLLGLQRDVHGPAHVIGKAADGQRISDGSVVTFIARRDGQQDQFIPLQEAQPGAGQDGAAVWS